MKVSRSLTGYCLLYIALLVYHNPCDAQSISKLSNNNRTYQAYFGIRYVKPIEDHFQEPVPIPDEPIQYYNGTEKPICAQIDPLTDRETAIGQKDCLVLNIYTHDINGNAPVMLWIYGGGWNFGAADDDMYGAGALMDEDILLVTFNYRVGPLGFASLEDEELPGNYGLKDQTEAIKWVYRNIRKFGGDPQKITLFGQSAGAASVMYHMKGKISGLLRGGIAQSGSSLTPWAHGPPGAVRKYTLKLAESLDCKRNTSEEIVNCLRALPAQRVAEGVKSFSLIERHLIPFRPVQEPNGLITEDPWNSPPSDLPLMTGFTSAEASFFAALFILEGSFVIRFLNAAFNSLIPEVLMYEETAPDVKSVTRAIREFYLGSDGNITMENIGPLVDMMSDSFIVHPTHAEAMKHNGTLYTYLFDHKGETSITKLMGVKQELGVCHGDDIPYFFNVKMLDLREVGNDKDRVKSREMVKIWTNFAKGLDPSTDLPIKHEDWNSLSKRGGFLEIGTDQYVLRDINEYSQSRLKERLNFWANIPYRKH